MCLLLKILVIGSLTRADVRHNPLLGGDGESALQAAVQGKEREIYARGGPCARQPVVGDAVTCMASAGPRSGHVLPGRRIGLVD